MDRCFRPLPLFVTYLPRDIGTAAPSARPAEHGPQDALLSALAALPAIGAVALATPDVDRADTHGNTPLMIAAANGDYAVLVDLHQSGGDVTVRNLEGHSALVLVLRALRRCSDNEERVRHSLTLKALLTALQGVLEIGGVEGKRARAILQEARDEARHHDQAEECMIVQILSPEKKGC